MKRGWQCSGGVSKGAARSDQLRTPRGEHAPRAANMTAAGVLGRVDEVTDGTGGSVDAVMGAAIGPYRKSRIRAT